MTLETTTLETMTMTMTGISPYASSIISFKVTLLATIQFRLYL
jgi:hypothetical protein